MARKRKLVAWTDAETAVLTQLLKHDHTATQIVERYRAAFASSKRTDAAIRSRIEKVKAKLKAKNAPQVRKSPGELPTTAAPKKRGRPAKAAKSGCVDEPGLLVPAESLKVAVSPARTAEALGVCIGVLQPLSHNAVQRVLWALGTVFDK